LFQPLCLFAGAEPPAALRTGFLLANESPVDKIYDAGLMEVASVEIEAVSLSGHSGNQMGLIVDGVFFCADVILPERVLEKYRMPYLYSVGDHIQALERALNVDHCVAVPGHGPVLDHVSEGVTPNAALVRSVIDIIVEVCVEPQTPENVLALVLERVGARPADPAAYYLLHPTVFAYLTYLESTDVVSHWIEDGRSYWRTS
jgi:glyoxylase-like metal-dependent hydrolase (beta-lactamase superfamily II)